MLCVRCLVPVDFSCLFVVNSRLSAFHAVFRHKIDYGFHINISLTIIHNATINCVRLIMRVDIMASNRIFGTLARNVNMFIWWLVFG